MNASEHNIEMIILDDHPLVRGGLVSLCKNQFPNARIKECSTIHEFKLTVHMTQNFLLILDLTLPDGHGFDVLHWIKAQAINCKVCVFTMHNHQLYKQKCLQLGASAFLPKESSPEIIIKTLHQILTDQKIQHSTLKKKEASHSHHFTEKYTLSPREIEVLEQLKKGLSSKEIAQLFNLSVRTIEMYRANILKKLNVSNTAAAISLWTNEISTLKK